MKKPKAKAISHWVISYHENLQESDLQDLRTPDGLVLYKKYKKAKREAKKAFTFDGRDRFVIEIVEAVLV